MSPDPAALARVRQALSEVYRPEGVDLWLKARHRLLGGRSALDCTEAEVLQVVEALASGAFT